MMIVGDDQSRRKKIRSQTFSLSGDSEDVDNIAVSVFVVLVEFYKSKYQLMVRRAGLSMKMLMHKFFPNP